MVDEASQVLAQHSGWGPSSTLDMVRVRSRMLLQLVSAVFDYQECFAHEKVGYCHFVLVLSDTKFAVRRETGGELGRLVTVYELDEKTEADSMWLGHSPINRARQFLAVQTALKQAGKSHAASQVAKAFSERCISYHSKDAEASQYLVTTHLRVLHRMTTQPAPSCRAPIWWIEQLEAHFGRRGPFESIYVMDALQKSVKSDQDLAQVVYCLVST